MLGKRGCELQIPPHVCREGVDLYLQLINEHGDRVEFIIFILSLHGGFFYGLNVDRREKKCAYTANTRQVPGPEERVGSRNMLDLTHSRLGLLELWKRVWSKVRR